MPAVKLSPIFNSQIVDENGAPAVGWKIYSYVAASSTPLATYTNSTGSVAQSNPVILNALGFPTMEQLWLQTGRAYKLVLTDQNDVVKKTEDNVSGVNDNANAADEWVDTGITPTYITASTFSLSGDQTSQFHVGRRLKFQVTAGTVYGRITASVFTTLTTVTVQMDGTQVLDSGLSLAQLSILRNNVLALPERIASTSGTDTYTASVGTQRLVIGDEYKIKFINQNLTSAPTLNLDSLGALAIVNQAGIAAAPGTLNGEQKIRYNGTNFTVLNPLTPLRIDRRHAIQYGPVTGANAVSDLIPQSQINNTLAVGVTAKFSTLATLLSIANGFNADGSPSDVNIIPPADLTITGLTASTTNYIAYDRINNVLVKSVLVDAYTRGGTPAVTAGQYTLDYLNWKNYLGNGTVAQQVQHLILAEVDTDATKVTAIRCRAYQGAMDSVRVAGLPVAGSVFTVQHNIGTSEFTSEFVTDNITANGGWVAGDVTSDMAANVVSGFIPFTKMRRRNTLLMNGGSTNTGYALIDNTGSQLQATIASWGYKFKVRRAF